MTDQFTIILLAHSLVKYRCFDSGMISRSLPTAQTGALTMTDEHHDLHAFERRLGQDWQVADWSDLSVLVAVSGGPDSVALLRALVKLRSKVTGKGTIHVGHFNHRWRAAASDQDEQSVRDLCERLAIRCHVGSTSSTEKKEEVARSQRYDFLRATAEAVGARYLVVAHNANDQAETILHRILRGTALRGLSGIPARRTLGEAVTLCRPMLWATREVVVDYLSDIGQPYRVDESNQDVCFTRNRIRHELLPQLAQEYNVNVVESLTRLGQVASEANQIIDVEVQKRLKESVRLQNDKSVELDRATLLKLPKHLLKNLFVALWKEQGWPEQSMGFEQWERLVEATRTKATINLPGKTRITTLGDVIRLIRFES